MSWLFAATGYVMTAVLLLLLRRCERKRLVVTECPACAEAKAWAALTTKEKRSKKLRDRLSSLTPEQQQERKVRISEGQKKRWAQKK